MMRIGVLALQGSFAEHLESFRQLGVAAREVRLPDDLTGLDGLVVPGGESTTISHLLHAFDLYSPLTHMIEDGLPVWGTCAGMIMLAKRSTDMPHTTFGAIDVSVKRNGWGRQVDSYEADVDVPALGEPKFRAIFIRPPVVTSVGPSVEKLALTEDGTVVAVREGNAVATSFHPELTGDLRFHDYFARIVSAARTAGKETENVAVLRP